MQLLERGVVPQWNQAETTSFTQAQDNKRALVFHFVEDGQWVDAENKSLGEKYQRAFYDNGMLEFSQKNAVFIVVKKAKKDGRITTGKADGEEASKADPLIPISPLASDDLFETFGAKVGDTVVTDWYGYDATKLSRIPSVEILTKTIVSHERSVKRYSKKAADGMEDVNEELEGKDTAKAVREVVKVLRIEKRGPEAMETAVETYTKLMEEARATADKHVENRDVASLEEMVKTYRRTGAEDYIKAAIERAKRAAAKVTDGKSSKVSK